MWDDVEETTTRAAPAKKTRADSKPRSSWRSWEGVKGRIWYDADGQPHFQVRQKINGHPYEFFLPSGLDHAAAMVKYKEFLDNPEGFDARGDVRGQPVFFTAQLLQDFLSWSKRYGGRKGTGTSERWRDNQRIYLTWWMEMFKKKDLRAGGPRSVSLKEDITDKLHTREPGTGEKVRIPAYRHRVGILIKFYRWLTESEHLIEPEQNPVLGRLKQPPPVEAQGEDDWKIVPIENVLAVVKWLRDDAGVPSAVRKLIEAGRHCLEQEGEKAFLTLGGGKGKLRSIAREAGFTPYTLYYYFKSGASFLESVKTGVYNWKDQIRPGRRFEAPEPRHPDMLLLLLATGWHLSELGRFMEEGKVLPEMALVEIQVQPIYSMILTAGDGVLVVSQAKRGGKLQTRVSRQALAVAQRLKGTGGFFESYFRKRIAEACTELKLPVFKPGWMRHTVSTYATNHAAPDGAKSAFLNHGSSTTSKYYDRGVALKVPTPF